MTSDAGSPTSNPPPAADGGGQGEEGRVRSLDDRFGKIEAEQERQGGILSRIEQAIGGGKGPKAGAATDTPAPASAPTAPEGGLSIAEQVRRGVAEIRAKEKADADAEAASAAELAERKRTQDRLDALESKPGEPVTGARTKLQRVLFGKADPR